MDKFTIPRPTLPDMIAAERAQGGLIHDLPPVATRELAVNYGLYTTTEPRDPGNFREFRLTKEREEAFASIAYRAGSILSKTKQYENAVREGVLGTRLVAAFSSVVRVECNDVHLVVSSGLPKDQEGIVTAAETRLFVPDIKQANDIGVALQSLLQTGSTETFYPVSIDTHGHGSLVAVEIGQLDEHAARSISRSTEAIIAREDHRRSVILPPNKRTYEYWRAHGETFPPAVANRLQNAVNGYERLEIAGTYQISNLQPRPKPRIIGTDAAPVFEGMRDILNGLIHHIRGGSHLNLEQHPIADARPLVEAGVDLRRDRATLEQTAEGPLSSRPASLAEQSANHGREQLAAIREHPYRAAARGASGVLSLPFGVLGIAGAAVKYLPAGSEAGRGLVDNYREWRHRQQLAAAGGERLDVLAAQLRRKQYGLGDWE